MTFNISPKIILPLFFAIGIGMLGFTFFLFSDAYSFVRNGVIQNARIDRYDSYTNDEGSVLYTPVFTYTVDDEEIYTKSSLSSSNQPFDIGEKVEIIYNADVPYDAEINTVMRIYGGVFAGGILGLSFFLAGGIPILIWYRGKQREQLKNTGIHVKATVTDIAMRMNIKINGRHPYRITATAMHPYTHTETTFDSKNLRDNPEEKVKKGDSIDVYVDQTKAKRYWMDTSFLQKP